jgi:putative transposase
MQIIKGKSSAWMKKKIKNKHGLYERKSLWARGYFVSTIGLDEHVIRRYVKHQHHHNRLLKKPTSIHNYKSLQLN